MLEIEEIAEHIERVYGPVVGLSDVETYDEAARVPDDRLRALRGGAATTIRIHYSTGDNAARYRGWLTLNRKDYGILAYGERPKGYEYLHLMIGYLPDGDPWWSALFDERRLPLEAAEEMHTRSRDGDDVVFYRFDRDKIAAAKLGDYDFLQPTLPFETVAEAVATERVVTPEPWSHAAVVAKTDALVEAAKAKPERKGKSWGEQKLRAKPFTVVINDLRARAAEGPLRRSDYDTDSPNYRANQSMKQLEIVAATALNASRDEPISPDDLTADLAWEVCKEIAFGSARPPEVITY